MTGTPPLPRAVLGVGSELELRATLQRVVDAAAELTGARYATLTTTGPGREDRTGVHTAGPSRTPHVPQGPGTWELPIDVDGEPFGRLHLAEKEGGEREFTAEDVRLLHVLAARAGLAIGNARRYEAARRRERWIEGAAAVTTALLTGGSAADALLTVAERARHLADAAAGVVLQRTEDGGMEIVVADTDETPAATDGREGIADPGDAGDPDDIVGATIRPGSPVLVQLLGGEPVFVDDSATDPRMTTHVRHRFGPSMMLPLQADGQLIGTLALPRRRGDLPYTEVEKLLAVQFASQAAVALVLADARHRRERLAVFEDRDRIARDLHDLVVQRLFATGMMLQAARRGTTRETDRQVDETLGRAVDELESTIQEVRTAIFALQQPPAEAPTTFRGRVLRETAGAAALLGFQPSTRFTGPVENRIPERTAGHLLTALRRALAAASGRPDVSRVEVVIDATAVLPDGRAGVRLTVHDDGSAGSTGDDGTTVTWQAPV
ncbi:GAF domain-containing sensor histidine kinase [Streptomyces sp. SLBN-115]|uniref:GAF domain-containing sensor histidine kinase n=1 Tax=Streptomyces sp. SLBN-115 TaxID=2768453 RepID=UPI00114EDBA4|nr:GAF domain-containing protein [Streptomyces sp. SLBN-115]TQJ52810.1 GAF domain-containing protein [Streptomyces sp. SLBN-115]